MWPCSRHWPLQLARKFWPYSADLRNNLTGRCRRPAVLDSDNNNIYYWDERTLDRFAHRPVERGGRAELLRKKFRHTRFSRKLRSAYRSSISVLRRSTTFDSRQSSFDYQFYYVRLSFTECPLAARHVHQYLLEPHKTAPVLPRWRQPFVCLVFLSPGRQPHIPPMSPDVRLLARRRIRPACPGHFHGVRRPFTRSIQRAQSGVPHPVRLPASPLVWYRSPGIAPPTTGGYDHPLARLVSVAYSKRNAIALPQSDQQCCCVETK